MYLENHLQDEKYGVRKRDTVTVNKNRLEKEIIEVQLNDFIETQFSGYVREKVRGTIHSLFEFYSKGMELDKTHLSHENFVQNNPEDLHIYDGKTLDFVSVEEEIELLQPTLRKMKRSGYQEISENRQHYFRLLLTRCHLMNALFFQLFATLLVDLFSRNPDQDQSLIKWSKRLGMISQLVNDINDYLPENIAFRTTSKKREDTWGDGRRKLFTLPMMAFFTLADPQLLRSRFSHHYQEQEHAVLKLRDISDQHEGLRALTLSRALRYSMHLVNQMAKGSKKLLNRNNPATSDLNQLLNVAAVNKFYVEYLGYNW